MRFERPTFALFVCIALWLALPAGAQVVHVYEVRHRIAEELLPLAETAMAGEGRVAADRRTNALVLSGSRKAVATALELLGALDVRAHTIFLRYEARRASDLASAGARVAWRAGVGGLRVGNVRWPGAGPASVAVEVDAVRERRTATLAGQLRILDGQTGRIATGASLPITHRRVERGRHGPVVSESMQLVSAESGFEASPRVLRDGRIELTLRPFDAAVRPDGVITHANADTVLALEPGETLALGGLLREERTQHRSANSGVSASDAADESLLLVTAEIE